MNGQSHPQAFPFSRPSNLQGRSSGDASKLTLELTATELEKKIGEKSNS